MPARGGDVSSFSRWTARGQSSKSRCCPRREAFSTVLSDKPCHVPVVLIAISGDGIAGGDAIGAPHIQSHFGLVVRHAVDGHADVKSAVPRSEAARAALGIRVGTSGELIALEHPYCCRRPASRKRAAHAKFTSSFGVGEEHSTLPLLDVDETPPVRCVSATRRRSARPRPVTCRLLAADRTHAAADISEAKSTPVDPFARRVTLPGPTLTTPPPEELSAAIASNLR